jgi:hypothetical protein
MIRDCLNEDSQQIERIHDKTSFDYKFPNLSDPLFVVKKVVEEAGEVREALALKLTASIYLWIDPDWGTPAMRLRKLKKLVEEAKRAAWEKGLDDVYAVIPPEIEEEFSEVLGFLGMTKDRPWGKWSINLEE